MTTWDAIKQATREFFLGSSPRIGDNDDPTVWAIYALVFGTLFLAILVFTLF